MSGEMIEAEIERLTADNCRLVDEREGWKKRAEALATAMEGAAQRMTVDRSHLTEERDAAQADLKQAEENNHGLVIEVANMRAGLELADDLLRKAQADVERLTTERDAAMVEVRSHIAANRRIAVERDAAEDCKDFHKDKCQKLQAENEGLRADLLAHPPQRIDFQQYCSLKADHEQQAATIEALQEALQRTESMLEESQGKGATLMRGAESDHQIILGLREALERSDKRLSQAKARQIPPALVGLLGVIRREAAAAEKMIL